MTVQKQLTCKDYKVATAVSAACKEDICKVAAASIAYKEDEIES